MRLIDADALNKDIEKYHVSDGKFQHWIELQPTVDAVPVVRCKDCKYHRGENACEKDGCYGWYDTDYCSRAERREE